MTQFYVKAMAQGSSMITSSLTKATEDPSSYVKNILAPITAGALTYVGSLFALKQLTEPQAQYVQNLVMGLAGSAAGSVAAINLDGMVDPYAKSAIIITAALSAGYLARRHYKPVVASGLGVLVGLGVNGVINGGSIGFWSQGNTPSAPHTDHNGPHIEEMDRGPHRPRQG